VNYLGHTPICDVYLAFKEREEVRVQSGSLFYAQILEKWKLVKRIFYCTAQKLALHLHITLVYG